MPDDPRPASLSGPLSAWAAGPLRVLDLSEGVAGGYCTKLLADAGADVVKVEPPEGSRLRRWSATAEDPAGDGALFEFLNTSKRSVTGAVEEPSIMELASRADVVVEDLDPARFESSGLKGLPGVVVVSISPYGRSGPWAGRPGGDLVVQAESGCVSGRGLPGGEPFGVGGRVFEFVAGGYAATAALAAAGTARRSGAGEHVDVSLTESAAVGSFSCHAELMARLDGVTPEMARRAPVARVEIPSIEPTADGWVGFTTNSRQQLDDFLVLIDRPELIGDERFTLAKDRWNYFEEWNHLVQEWTTKHTTEEVIERAVELRIPVAPVANAETVRANPQFVARGVFEPNPSGGFAQPRCPYTITGVDRPVFGPVPQPGEHTGTVDWAEPAPRGGGNPSLPLAGLKVLDMTAWFAGPLAAHFLATLGADVVHLEATTRMDGMRATGGALAQKFPDWWECSSQFLSINTDKRGVTLDLRADAGRRALDELIGWADVLIENFTPRVMGNFGLTWEALHDLNPNLVLVRMPAFGLDGPWRDWTGFAQTMEQVTGLAWVTGHVDDQPRIQRGPCDIVSGVHAVFAALVALEVRRQTGQGVMVESTMVEAALNAAAEQIVEYGKYGHVMGRQGNRSAWAAPQGLYRRDDGSWLAVSVERDEHFDALCRALGASDWAADPALATHSGRRARHDELDRRLSEWVAARGAETAADQLAAAGVPAGLVADQRFLSQRPQFAARRFFEELDHPVVGRQPVPGMPFRFASVDRWLHRPAPLLGEHNHQVLVGDLGLGEQEFEALRAAGVIGDRPAGL
ncbi:MAG: CoA transferase [Acidobacteriota bacterium]|nr:CoA transferase [Acidobacteriota bacterium]